MPPPESSNWDVLPGKENGGGVAEGPAPLPFPVAKLAKPPLKIDLGRGSATFIALSPDGKTVAFGLSFTPNILQKSEFTTVLYDVPTGSEIARLDGRTYASPNTKLFSPDGKTLAIGYSNSQISLWDLETREELHAFEGSRWNENSVFTPNGRLLVGLGGIIDEARGGNANIFVWDVARGKKLHYFGNDPNTAVFGITYGNAPVHAFTLSADGNTLVAEHYHATKAPTLRSSDRKRTFEITTHLWYAATGRHMGQVGDATKWEWGGRGPYPVGRKLSEAGAYSDGYRARISPACKILVFPAYRPDVRVTLAKHSGDFYLVDPITGNELARFRDVDGVRPESAYAIALAPDGKTLVAAGSWAGNEGSTLVIADVSGLAPQDRPLKPDHSAEELRALWIKLADQDASKAHRAMYALARSPQQTVAFLREHLRPMPALTPERITQLLADLDSDRAELRENAEQEWIKLEDQAIPPLREALKGPLGVHRRRQVEWILGKLTCDSPSAETRQALWGIELLENLGTPEARQLLEKLAEGAPNAWLTLEAKASLPRLAKRPAPTP